MKLEEIEKEIIKGDNLDSCINELVNLQNINSKRVDKTLLDRDRIRINELLQTIKIKNVIQMTSLLSEVLSRYDTPK